MTISVADIASLHGVNVMMSAERTRVAHHSSDQHAHVKPKKPCLRAGGAEEAPNDYNVSRATPDNPFAFWQPLVVLRMAFCKLLIHYCRSMPLGS